jgi:hypothetical protein
VAVQSAQFTTQTELVKPYTPGQAAAAGALQGGLGLATSGEEVGVLLMPVGVMVGGVVGGIHGTPKEATEAAGNELRKACAELDFQETVRKDVIAAMRKQTRHPVIQAGKFGTGSIARANSLLEVNVQAAGLCGSKYKNARLPLFLRGQVRLLSWPDGAVLYELSWLHTSGNRTFCGWAAQGARPFRRELAIASRALAESIITQIFLAGPPRKSDWFM